MSQSPTAAGTATSTTKPQSSVEKRVVARRVAPGIGAREPGQEHGAERDSQERRRKFHQAVGIVEPRHGSLAQMRGDVRVDEDRELRDAHAKERRHHEFEYAAHVRVGQTGPEAAGSHADAEAAQRQILGAELQNAAHNHRNGQRPDGLGHAGRQKHRGADEGEVEQNGVTAGTAKRFQVLSTEAASAVRAMKAM